MSIGVVGLGNVGIGISNNLLEAGFDVVGYDLAEEPREAAAKDGVTIASNNEDLAERCNVILLSLPHPDASRAAVEAICESGASDIDVFDTSTLSPLTARELHEQALEDNVYYFDSPITGGEVGAKAGKLIHMVGGDPDRLAEHEEIFSAIATDVYHIGDIGDGQFVKLIHNHVGQTSVIIFIESCLLAEEFGVDPAIVYRTLRHYTQIYDDKLDSFFSNEFSEEFDDHFALGDEGLLVRNQFNLNVAHKDLIELKNLADEYETHLPLGNFVEQYHRQGMNAGFADRAHPDLLQLYTDLFDKEIQSYEERREKSEGKLF